jgi:hypothetical protein
MSLYVQSKETRSKECAPPKGWECDEMPDLRRQRFSWSLRRNLLDWREMLCNDSVGASRKIGSINHHISWEVAEAVGNHSLRYRISLQIKLNSLSETNLCLQKKPEHRIWTLWAEPFYWDLVGTLREEERGARTGCRGVAGLRYLQRPQRSKSAEPMGLWSCSHGGRCEMAPNVGWQLRLEMPCLCSEVTRGRHGRCLSFTKSSSWHAWCREFEHVEEKQHHESEDVVLFTLQR